MDKFYVVAIIFFGGILFWTLFLIQEHLIYKSNYDNKRILKRKISIDLGWFFYFIPLICVIWWLVISILNFENLFVRFGELVAAVLFLIYFLYSIFTFRSVYIDDKSMYFISMLNKKEEIISFDQLIEIAPVNRNTRGRSSFIFIYKTKSNPRKVVYTSLIDEFKFNDELKNKVAKGVLRIVLD